MPHELAFMGVYFSPFLLVLLGGIVAAVLTFLLFIRWGGNRYFANPPWIFVALVVIYTCLLASFGVVL